MNKKILPSIFSVSFLFLVTCSYAQKLDLIVTSKADSIACHIDSITDTHIYYQMKSRSTWIHTQIPRSEVLQYKQDIIDKREYLYKPGTTIIDSSIPAISSSLYHIRKNSVYLGLLSINYARMIPLSHNTGLTLGGGLINFDGWGVVAESSVLIGGVRHFLEPGIMGFYFFVPSEDYNNPDMDVVDSAVSIRVGYRYQAPWGLLIRAAPNLIFTDQDTYLFPALSVGYSF
ncbi:MAG: hypothetical protein ABFS38_06380 [Bacteroidota bacterium]